MVRIKEYVRHVRSLGSGRKVKLKFKTKKAMSSYMSAYRRIKKKM